MSQSTSGSTVPRKDFEPHSGLHPSKALKDYLLKHEAVYRELSQLKEQGWSSTEGDRYFQRRHERADQDTQESRESLFRLTIKIGDEMAQVTNVFNLDTPQPLVLDLCMAPGGFTASVMKRFPRAVVEAITLPAESGGHPVMARSRNLKVVYADITMYAADFGVKKIPDHHPDFTVFSSERPFSNSSYDLVFCGGAVLRTQKRADYREKGEPARLTLSQLIFAFQRIKSGGTLVLLLHQPEAWDTLCILRAFSHFADIQLFKPLKAHAIKSSFYLIAKNVRPKHPEAVKAVNEWKRIWNEMTFEVPKDTNTNQLFTSQEEYAKAVRIVEEFGPRLIELARPVWQTQAAALKKSSFVKSKRW